MTLVLFLVACIFVDTGCLDRADQNQAVCNEACLDDFDACADACTGLDCLDTCDRRADRCLDDCLDVALADIDRC